MDVCWKPGAGSGPAQAKVRRRLTSSLGAAGERLQCRISGLREGQLFASSSPRGKKGAWEPLSCPPPTPRKATWQLGLLDLFSQKG
jgi:hypothetical protein